MGNPAGPAVAPPAIRGSRAGEAAAPGASGGRAGLLVARRAVSGGWAGQAARRGARVAAVPAVGERRVVVAAEPGVAVAAALGVPAPEGAAVAAGRPAGAGRGVAAGDEGLSRAAAAPIVIAIDGPGGVGKSTAARRLARRLGVPFLDTGAMYRAIALRVLERGVDPADRAAVEAVAAAADIALRQGPDGSFAVLLDGAAVEPAIRAPGVGEAASVVAAHPAVRRRLVELQRATARRFGGVLEGRDIGTRVFPETPYKFFLDARPEVRVARRRAELLAAGRQVTAEEVGAELAGRDRRDASRSDSPLTRDPSYTFVDASDIDIDEVVEHLAQLVAAHAP
jgi:cytidylate kinase